MRASCGALAVEQCTQKLHALEMNMAGPAHGLMNGKWIVGISEYANRWKLTNSSKPSSEQKYASFERKTEKEFQDSMDSVLSLIQDECVGGKK
jgi:hypothetical protein